MIFYMKPSVGRKGGVVTEDSFSFDGNYLFWHDENGDFELALLESGTLTFLVDPGLVDVFICGSGANGTSGTSPGNYEATGGNGGKGGEIKNETATLYRNTEYPVVIGAVGENTSAFGITAQSGAGTPEVGVGGHIYRDAAQKREPTPGNDGEKAFSGDGSSIYELSATKFGASGGGARCASLILVSVDPDWWVEYPTNGGSIAGGATGGGNGGSKKSAGNPATTNTGSGGGGGGCYGEAAYAGGAGATGIVMIRPHRG